MKPWLLLSFFICKVSLSLNPAIITYVAPNNGACTGGLLVSIVGINFDQPENPTGTIGDTECSSVAWMSESSIGCVTSPGVDYGGGGGLEARLVTSFYPPRVLSVQDNVFSYDAPVVTGFTTASGETPVEGSFSITIFGLNFGPHPPPLHTKVGEEDCTVPLWQSDTSIVCFAGAAGKEGRRGLPVDITVDVGGIYGRAPVFKYNKGLDDGSGYIARVYPHNGPGQGGRIISVMGSEFGFQDITPTVTVGSTPCVDSSWVSNELIECVLHAGSGTHLPLSVAAEGEVHRLAKIFHYDAAVIKQVIPDGLHLEGGAITISGTNFLGTSPSVTVCGEPCDEVEVRSPFLLVCVAPPARDEAFTGIGCDVQVTSDGAVSTAKGLLNYYDPYADAASISVLSPDFAHPHPQQPIIVEGSGFGNKDCSPSIKLGDTYCYKSIWVSDDALQCMPASGVGTELALRVQVGLQRMQIDAAFSYEGPSIHSLKPVHASVDGGSTLTVRGEGFGPRPAHQAEAPAVSVDSVPCMRVSWVSDHSLLCVIPESDVVGGGMGDAGVEVPVSVNVGGQETTIHNHFTYTKGDHTPRPVITRLDPRQTPTSGGNITLHGYNFGSHDYDAPTIAVGLTDCLRLTWVSSRVLECAVAPGVGWDLVVSAFSQRSTPDGPVNGEVLFNYEHPLVAEVKPRVGMLSGGYTVTVLGENFGPPSPDPPDGWDVEVLVGGNECIQTTYVSEKELLCVVPSASVRAGTIVMVVASVNELYSSPSPAFMYVAFTPAPTAPAAPLPDTEDPEIQELVPRQGPASGRSVVVFQGRHFGLTDSTPTASIGHTPCLQSVWLSQDQVKCEVSPGVGELLDVQLEFPKRHNVAWPRVFSYNLPMLTRVVPGFGPLSGGFTISVNGINFGPKPPTDPEFSWLLEVSIGDYECAKTRYVSDTQLLCEVPVFTGTPARGALDVTVTVDRRLGRGINMFTFTDGKSTRQQPKIKKIKPSHAPPFGAASITFLGTNFGALDLSPTAYIGHTACDNTLWMSSNKVVCQVSAGVGGQLSAQLNVDLLSHALVEVFSYDAPIIAYVRPSTGDTKGGYPLTVDGINFGPQPPDEDGGDNDFQPKERLAVMVDDRLCASTAWLSDDAVVCASVPACESVSCTSVIVAVIVGDQKIQSDDLFTFKEDHEAFTAAQPEIESLEPSEGPTLGNVAITFHGNNFGKYISYPLASVGGTRCLKTTWVSDSEIVCNISPGLGTRLTASLFIYGAPSVAKWPDSFSYLGPKVLSLDPDRGAAMGHYTVTVNGVNFGPDPSHIPEEDQWELSARIGNAECDTVAWVSDAQLLCALPVLAGVKKGDRLLVSVVVNDLEDRLENAFLIDDDAPLPTPAPSSPTTASPSADASAAPRALPTPETPAPHDTASPTHGEGMTEVHDYSVLELSLGLVCVAVLLCCCLVRRRRRNRARDQAGDAESRQALRRMAGGDEASVVVATDSKSQSTIEMSHIDDMDAPTRTSTGLAKKAFGGAVSLAKSKAAQLGFGSTGAEYSRVPILEEEAPCIGGGSPTVNDDGDGWNDDFDFDDDFDEPTSPPPLTLQQQLLDEDGLVVRGACEKAPGGHVTLRVAYSNNLISPMLDFACSFSAPMSTMTSNAATSSVIDPGSSVLQSFTVKGEVPKRVQLNASYKVGGVPVRISRTITNLSGSVYR